MDQQRLKYLFSRYQMEVLSKEEHLEWLEALTDPGQNQAIDDLAQGIFEKEDLQKYQLDESNASEILQSILKQPQLYRQKSNVFWKRYALVAAAMLAIVTCIWFYNSNLISKQNPKIVHQADINQGKEGATLNLSDGRILHLNEEINGKVAEADGVVITKSSTGKLIYEVKGKGAQIDQLNILSTGKGETFEVVLPDGSHVWLNAASSLAFSTGLQQHTKRIVKLEGEGYFEIAKNKERPFVVNTAFQEIEVLGTHFNINDYRNEPFTKTTLVEGSVKVITASGATSTLKPNQESVVTKSGQLKVNAADIGFALAWKNKEFLFDGA